MAETFKNAGLEVTTVAQTVYTCPASATSVIHAMYLSNVDGTQSAKVTIKIYDSSEATEFHVGLDMEVPIGSSLILDKPINLESNDELRILADTTGDIEALASILEIT